MSSERVSVLTGRQNGTRDPIGSTASEPWPQHAHTLPVFLTPSRSRSHFTSSMASKARPSKIPRRSEPVIQPISPMAVPTSTSAARNSRSTVPRNPESAAQRSSSSIKILKPKPIVVSGISKIPRRTDHAAPFQTRESTSKMAADARLSKIPRRTNHTVQPTSFNFNSNAATETQSSTVVPGRVHAAQTNPLSSGSDSKTHQPTISNHNSNVNHVYGSVHSLINNNPITIIYGPVPNESVRSASTI